MTAFCVYRTPLGLGGTSKAYHLTIFYTYHSSSFSNSHLSILLTVCPNNVSSHITELRYITLVSRYLSIPQTCILSQVRSFQVLPVTLVLVLLDEEDFSSKTPDFVPPLHSSILFKLPPLQLSPSLLPTLHNLLSSLSQWTLPFLLYIFLSSITYVLTSLRY